MLKVWVLEGGQRSWGFLAQPKQINCSFCPDSFGRLVGGVRPLGLDF